MLKFILLLNVNDHRRPVVSIESTAARKYLKDFFEQKHAVDTLLDDTLNRTHQAPVEKLFFQSSTDTNI